MPQKSDGYIKGSQELIGQARDEFAQGDFRQASEKAWGAAAQGVKALAAERNWNHDTHSLLFDVVGQVNDERRGRLLGMFAAAHQLHINFYEDWLEPANVQEGIDTVAVFLQRMERARQARQPRFTPRTDRQRSRMERLTGGRH